MKSEIVPSAPEHLELQGESTEVLRSRLRAAIGMTEEAIRTVATLWRELQRRGEDMSEFRTSLSPFLPAVADGRLLPALVVKLSGQTRALARLAELKVDDQQRLLQGEVLAIYRGGDHIERKQLDHLTYSEILLSIRDGRIWSVEEQRMAHQRSEEARRRLKSKGRPVTLSVTSGNRIRIGRIEVEAERIIALLRAEKLI